MMKMKLSEMMNSYFKEEDINTDYKCDNCKKKTSIIKFTSIAVLPPVLVLHIKRFDGIHGKSTGLVDFNEKIDVKDYLVKKSEFEANIKEDYNKSSKYQLFAVAEHIGSSLNSGHYIAFCKRDNKWYRFSDSSVSLANESEAVSKNSYLLFYKRM